MSRQTLILTAMIALLTVSCASEGADKESDLPASTVSLKAGAESEAFEKAEIRFEQNATDGDVEVVFDVLGGDEGLLKARIVGPDGRTVVDFTAPDASTMGIRSFSMESPEPTDISALKEAYPEGVYKFAATDTQGSEFFSEAALSHELPETAALISPEEEAEDVPLNGLEITWRPVEGMVMYIVEVEIEDDALEDNVLVKLPGSASSFMVPDHFLRPGAEYKISIGTVSEEGNISYVESTFMTEGETESE